MSDDYYSVPLDFVFPLLNSSEGSEIYHTFKVTEVMFHANLQVSRRHYTSELAGRIVFLVSREAA